MSENKKIVGTISLEEGMAKFIDNNDVKLPATIWLDYYKQKLKESKQTFRDNGFEIIENALKDYERRLELAKEYEDINNVAKRLKTLDIIKEKKWLVEDILDAFIEDKEKYDLVKEVLL